MSARDLILTGLPRSGTTLVCALIDSLHDAVCLSEPAWQDAWPREADNAQACARLVHEDFARVRHVLRAGDAVTDRRAADGAPVTNYFPRAVDGSRTAGYALLPFRREGLGADFLLGMKQNAHFTCMLAELAEYADFDIIAVVRHPLATIRSWRSASDLPIAQGRLPAAERLWPQIASLTTVTDDILLRQVRIYQLFCERYRALGARIHLLRYEDMVESPGMLGDLCGGRRQVRTVEIRRSPECPDDAETATILHYVHTHCPIARELYPDIGTVPGTLAQPGAATATR